MTDNICYSILKTATQQIIQSAGFEGANNNSIDTLADVFGKYIELLGTTVSAYANLNGRTIGAPIDLLRALKEADLEPTQLKHWLEDEGKSLTPSWSAQSDPGRLIQGVVNGGKPKFEDLVEYRYDYGIDEFDILSPEINSPSSPPLEREEHGLPDYVPPFFPAFPEIKEDEVMEELFKKEQQELLQQKKQQEEQRKEQLPLPVVVKNRKKPIENPFTHIIPFEDSSLAVDDKNKNEQQQQKPLSLLVNVNSHEKRTEKEEEEMIAKRRKLATCSLIDALSNVKSPDYKLGEGIIDKDHDLFRYQTEKAAAPGNYLFNHDLGVFDQVVRSMADPMVISKITAPNLQTDLAVFTNVMGSNPATPSYGTNPFGDTPSPESAGLHRSSSMLAALAGGASKKSGYKKLNPHIPSSINKSQTLSKHSVDINAIKTGDSKYIIKKKRMLAEKQMQLERQQQMERDGISPSTLDSPNTSMNPNNSTNNPQSSQTPFSTPLSLSTSANTNTTAPPAPPPVKLNGSGPISLSSFAAASSSNAGSTTNHTSLSKPDKLEKEKKKSHKPKGPKLMLNFSSLPPVNPTEDVSPSPNTPKIRFKINPPEQQQQQQSSSNGIKLHATTPSISKPPKPVKSVTNPAATIPLQQPYQQPNPINDNYGNVSIKLEKPQVSPVSSMPRLQLQQQPQSNFATQPVTYNAEEIRCICENPTVDYGTFMIACDNCSVWYHGTCVGIAESDQVEEWYCDRCGA